VATALTTLFLIFKNSLNTSHLTSMQYRAWFNNEITRIALDLPKSPIK